MVGPKVMMQCYQTCCVMQMVLCCLLNRGDPLLCDEYTYSHLVEAMVGPKGYDAVPVPMDEFGMTPESLDKVISTIFLHNAFIKSGIECSW